MLKPLFVSTLLAAPVVATPTVRAVIAEHPAYFASLAVAFAVGGGLAVQYRAIVHGTITTKQASAELSFSAIAGLIAFWFASKRQWEEIDLWLAALLLGVAGRPIVLSVQKVVGRSLLTSLAKVLEADHDGAPDPPCAEGGGGVGAGRPGGPAAGPGGDRPVAGPDDPHAGRDDQRAAGPADRP